MYQQPMRPILRLLGLLLLGSLGTGCMNSTILGPRLRNVPACSANGAAAADIQMDELPAWVLERNTLVKWVGDDLVLAGGTPPQVRIALIDGSTGRIRELPLGPIEVPRPEADWRAYHTLVGNHVVSLWHSYAIPNVHGIAVNLTNGEVVRLSNSVAPPAKVLNTSPYVTAKTQNAFVLWPRSSGNGVDLNAGLVLDVRTGTWSPISTNLGRRNGANVASLADGRIIVWGGYLVEDQRRPLRQGAILQVEDRAVRPFEYPAATRIGFSGAARNGALLATAASTFPFLEGYVLDIDSGKTINMPSVALEQSFRNHSTAHFDGQFFLYVARDEIWVFDVATAKWKSHLMPFEPNAPSDIAMHELEPGRSFFVGTSTGDYIFQAAEGRFCSVPRSDKLVAPIHVAVSRKKRAILGSVYFTGGGAPGCPPGAPCAVEAPQRVEDLRGVISVIP